MPLRVNPHGFFFSSAPTSSQFLLFGQRLALQQPRCASRGYRVTDERLGEVGKVYRLVTTLLNPRVAPALVLIALYHERWEIELVIDEIKTHERAQRKVLRSKTPEGVRQELYGIYLAHYAVRAQLAQAAVESQLDPDRLSFTEGLFELTEMISLALTVEPEEATEPLLKRLRHKMAQHVFPARRLRIN